VAISRRQVIMGGLATTLLRYMPIAVQAQEPLTFGVAAAWVGMKLLEGALNYAGGQLMAAALGDPTISDVRIWIQSAVAELEAFVSAELRRQLEANAMREMKADLQGVITNVHQYASLSPGNRERNRFLIEDSASATASLVPLSLDYDQAFFVTTTAVAYRLFTLYAMFELDSDAGHIKSGRPLMDDFVTHAIVIRDRIAIAMSPDSHFRINCGIIGEDKSYCSATRDGQLIVPVMTAPLQICRQGVCRDADEVMRELIARRLAPLTQPMQAQADEFQRLANSSIKLAITAYTTMCAKVGVAYSPPIDIGSLERLVLPTFPEIVVMPGAIVARPD
jgi:hypothetical protein